MLSTSKLILKRTGMRQKSLFIKRNMVKGKITKMKLQGIKMLSQENMENINLKKSIFYQKMVEAAHKNSG